MKRVEDALESVMRWVPEEPVSVEGPVQVGYQQAVQMERIADQLERIADVLERTEDCG